ncbi:Cytochrome p450 51g1 [Hibiscus syriacus]|uniref:Cytochrome p450 51g1 n=1 Tax=Hibiscus syriacus TaxID=106335 RepID=A0A6A3ANL8_HIBSY|nr:mediator-associated protein 2-like [Hibiscus syriacus]XP_038998550.1 mediator-associated protein 2-like [Hibiscus syriacus]XP_038998551.1 mediator-associated protein 2-like [Hibiscus syriacus]XP_038998552.1 mediator-associated protein 2-like [Hibiscus syriacus]KAE8706210.1 Cytochrome p450 51g1 [Hibiscus syriacus]
MNSEVNAYRPPPEFDEDSSQQLVDLTLSDSTELFLIQWPLHQNPEINGEVVTLQLDSDGKLGSFTDSTGKDYDLVSSTSKVSDATVIFSSGSESKIVGKISRRVSLVHYTTPEEYEQLSSNKKLIHQRSSGMTDSFATPMQSKGRRSSMSLGRTVSTHGSRQKNTVSGINEQSKPSKRKHGNESKGSMNQPTPSHETTPISGSLKHGSAHKSKKVKNEE